VDNLNSRYRQKLIDDILARVRRLGLGGGGAGVPGPPGPPAPTATTAVKGISRVDHNSAGDPVALTAAGHGADADPHVGYQKESEKAAASGYASLDGTTKVPLAQLPTGTTAATVALGNAAAGLITTHEAAADPHIGYQKESERGAASGYAPLDSGILVPVAYLPAATTTAKGVVELATSAEITAGLAVQASDTRLSDARAPLAHDTSLITTGTLGFARGGTGLAALGAALQVLRTNAGITAMEWATPAAAGGPYATRKQTADQVIGTGAAALTLGGVALALAAASKYRFQGQVLYENGTTTARHSLRITYSGTLGAVATHESYFKAHGTAGAPAAFAATYLCLSRYVNGVIIAAAAGFGNIGATAGIPASIEIFGFIFTGTAGNLGIEMISSAVGGLNVQAGSRIDVWDVTNDI